MSRPKNDPYGFVANLAGFKLTDDELKAIASPRAEVCFHITARYLQIGSTLGFIAGPICSLVSGNRDSKRLGRSLINGASVGMGIGLIASALTFRTQLRKYNDDEFYDRAYRIRCNRLVLNLDRFFVIGSFVGGILGAATVNQMAAEWGARNLHPSLTPNRMKDWRIVFGVCATGCATGFLLGVFQHSMNQIFSNFLNSHQI